MNLDKFDDFDNKKYEQFSRPNIIQKDLQDLTGILKGVKSDNVINIEESKSLLNWLKETEYMHHLSPYSEIKILLNSALSLEVFDNEEIEDILWLIGNFLNREKPYFDIVTREVQELQGIIKGIIIDKHVNEKELNFVRNWIEKKKHLRGIYPFDNLLVFIDNLLEDDVVDEVENEKALEFCNAILTGSPLSKIKQESESEKNIEILIQEKTFCITGESIHHPRKIIAQKIELYGGFVANSVTKNLDYLLICDERNSCWAFKNYGRKIEKANLVNSKGGNINIIYEAELYNKLNSLLE